MKRRRQLPWALLLTALLLAGCAGGAAGNENMDRPAGGQNTASTGGQNTASTGGQNTASTGGQNTASVGGETTGEAGESGVTAAAAESGSGEAGGGEAGGSQTGLSEDGSGSESAGSDTAPDFISQETEISKQNGVTRADKVLLAMDTTMVLTAYGEEAAEACDAAAEEIRSLHEMLSTGREDSLVSQLNKNGGGELTEDAAYLLKRAKDLHAETGGLFDISIYPVMDLWGFTREERHVPSEQALAEALAKVDASALAYDEGAQTVTFGIDGQMIDFGGIAKGYTSAKIMETFRKFKVTGALANLGGNVEAIGTKPDGSDFRVGVRHPKDDTVYLGVLSIHDLAVITSGGYERYFEENGQTYHHIIDPRTGYPASSGLTSVTIVSGDGTLADGLSTSLYIMGKDAAIEYWKTHKSYFDAVLYTDEGELLVTEGLKGRFSSDLPFSYVEG